MLIPDTLKKLDIQIYTLRSQLGAKWSIIFLLMPLLCFGVYHFGPWALWVVSVSVGSCMMFGIISRILCHEPYRWIHSGSIITGLLLGLTLRGDTPLYMIIIGALVAEYLGKHLTDLQQRPLLNPAILGRTAVGILETIQPPQVVDGVSSASVLFKSAGGSLYPDFSAVFLGFRSGAIGETHTLLLLVISFFLLRYVILKWEPVIAMLSTVFLMIWVLPPTAEIVGHAPWFLNPVIYLFGGSTLFCALLFASDPATTPTTRWGGLLFGIGAGMIGVLGKVYTSIQGIEMYGILLMNLTVPFLNQWFKHSESKPFHREESPLQFISPPEKLKPYVAPKPVNLSEAEGIHSFYAQGKGEKSVATEMKYRKNPHPQGVQVPHFKAYAQKEAFMVFKHILAQGMHREVLLEKLQHLGLRGCGGAHFPTHSKWLSVCTHPAPRILVINGLEGEPQSFKDNYLMQQHATTLVEGGAIAAYTVGAEYLYIVINSSYVEAFSQVHQAVTQFQQAVGNQMSLSIEVVKGPNPELYVCGEETALIQYLQSQRAEPQLRPPYPTERGLWGRPTLVNNVETLAWLPILLDPDSLWAKNSPPPPLLKLISLSGAIHQEGVYEVSSEQTLGDIFQMGGGMKPNEQLLALAVGGISGGFLPPQCLNLRYDSDTLLKAGAMLGSGAIEVLSHSSDLWTEALRAAHFFWEESCGRCTPCRVGTQQLLHLGTHFNRSQHLDLLLEVSEAMRLSSSCGFGMTAPRPLLSVLRYWETESTEGHSSST